MKRAAYEDARCWAAYWSQHWFLGADGEDRLAPPGGPSAGWATHVEAYDILLAVALDHLGFARERPALPRRLKALGLDRPVRAWAMRASAVGRSRPPARDPSATGTPPEEAKPERIERPVAFVLEIPTPSMTEASRLVAAWLPSERRILACADPRALRLLDRHGLPPHRLLLPLARERLLLRDGRRLLERLDSIASIPPAMQLAGADLGRAAIAAVGLALRRSLPWLAVERAALDRFAERFRPGAWAVASDQHRIGRLVVESARRHGTPVTVLQHGLPQGEIGYLPVVADRVATWSDASATWFKERATAAHRLTVTGNPRFDDLARTDRWRRAGPKRPSVLLALSPSSVASNTIVVRTVLDALTLTPDATLTVKLHPGHREWAWVDELVASAQLGARVRVVHHAGLQSLLRGATVTLVHRSSVALESLVAGVPVVVVAGDEPSVADLELADLGLVVAGDANALAGAISALVTDEGRAEWFAGRRAAIERFTGPTDGRSTERVAELLLADADGVTLDGPAAPT